MFIGLIRIWYCSYLVNMPWTMVGNRQRLCWLSYSILTWISIALFFSLQKRVAWAAYAEETQLCVVAICHGRRGSPPAYRFPAGSAGLAVLQPVDATA